MALVTVPVLHNELTQTCCTLMRLCLSVLSSGGQHGHVQPFSDEDASIETLSHCSSFSDTTSVADEGRSAYSAVCFFTSSLSRFEVCPNSHAECDSCTFVSGHSYQCCEAYQASLRLLHLVVLPGGEAAEDTAQEDFQYKLKGFIDSTVDKR